MFAGERLWRRTQMRRLGLSTRLRFSPSLLCGYAAHTHTHTLCLLDHLASRCQPASQRGSQRDLARLIISALIECRGTLQGWVIKLMQRMFVSTVYLSAAKRYITHTHARTHAKTRRHTQPHTGISSPLRASRSINNGRPLALSQPPS